MEVIKKQSKTTIKVKKGKDVKEVKPFHFFLVTDNGKSILIKPVFKDDYARLDMVAKYVK